MEIASARRIAFKGLSLENKRFDEIFHHQSYVPVRVSALSINS
jgi:hypothetical protein